ncbi:MAG: phage holin family protein [Prevotellaceae bacterium]|nr:phage holin family protein [Prevotellaceae bacterium]
MFASDKNIDNLQQLFIEFKKYLELQKEYTKLELTEKLSVLLSTMVLVLLLIVLGMIALFYLSLTFAYVLSPLVGGLVVSYGIIAAFHLLLILLIAVFRKKLIIHPMVRFLAELFLNTDKSS